MFWFSYSPKRRRKKIRKYFRLIREFWQNIQTSKFWWKVFRRLKNLLGFGGIKPFAMDLAIIAYNGDYIVFNKSPATLVHPTKYNEKNTLLNGLLHYLSQNPGHWDQSMPGPIHRLDRDTSGIVIFALNQASKSDLSKKMMNHQFQKFYQTLVTGQTPLQGEINTPLSIANLDRNYTIIDPENGKTALTHFRRIAYFPESDCSLLEIEIFTGRSHQIRVHMQSIGHPVLGDELYGDQNQNQLFAQKYGLNRQFLHAARLKFRDQDQEFTAPLFPDLAQVLHQLESENIPN
ncbi:MAG TPA: RluA family pseudouridine synthase [Candidatus Gracilibacteria bacterium]|nr:RluA family pseudouridine synthase [Candidatus Gracilibacteria bacterium]